MFVSIKLFPFLLLVLDQGFVVSEFKKGLLFA